MSYNLITVEGWLEGAVPRVNMGALREAKMKNQAQLDLQLGRVVGRVPQLGPQLGRVVAQVSKTKHNSVHNSTEL